MYNINEINFGDKIKKCRKKQGMKTNELADAIIKSTNAIYKYENGTVIPDAVTLLEICNALNMDINKLISCDEIEKKTEVLSEKIGTDQLYLYYLSKGSIVTSKIKILKDEVILYNGLKIDPNLDESEYAYKYIGNLNVDNEIAIFNLQNMEFNSNIFDYTIIKLNMKFKKDNVYVGNIVGINIENNDFMKKCIACTERISSEKLKDFYKQLIISKEEKDILDKFGYFETATRRMDEFYFEDTIIED